MAYNARHDRESMRKRNLERANKVVVPKYKAKHTVAEGETLSHIAMKHYGHATKPYYMVIYDANKNAIGSDPNKVKPGLALNIPELPEALKDG